MVATQQQQRKTQRALFRGSYARLHRPIVVPYHSPAVGNELPAWQVSPTIRTDGYSVYGWLRPHRAQRCVEEVQHQQANTNPEWACTGALSVNNLEWVSLRCAPIRGGEITHPATGRLRPSAQRAGS